MSRDNLLAEERILAALAELTERVLRLADDDTSLEILADIPAELAPLAAAFRQAASALRQRAERSEREAEFLQTVINAIPDLIFCKDRDGVFQGCNDAFAAKFIGRPREQIVSLTDYDIIPDRDLADSYRQQDRDILAAGIAVTSDDSLTLADGRTVHMETIKVPYRDRNGEFAGLIGIAHNITKRKNAEQSLARSTEMLRLILDSTAEGIHGIDLNGCCTFCNRACLDLLGYEHEAELLGKNMHELTHHTYPDGAPYPVQRCKIYQAYQSGEGTHADDELFWRKDGSSVPVEYWSYPQFQNGVIIGTVVTYVDISKRKKAEAALLEHQQKLQEVNQNLEQRVVDEVQKNRDKDQMLLQQDKLASIGQLAAGVAHEINNPMAFITGNLRSLARYYEQITRYDRLLKERFGEEAAGAAGTVFQTCRKSLDLDYILADGIDVITESLAGAERVTKIVRDLKGFSRIDALGQDTVELSSCLESALDVCYNQLKYDAVIRKEFVPGPLVQCHPGQLNQLFLNLLVNAGQAVKPPGEIVLKSWHDEEFVYASVSDNGEGIPEELLGRIFEPFFTTKEVGKGAGLGLSISSQIALNHHGELLVASQPGVGTTFTVKLPRPAEDTRGAYI